jgi:hypothetical protein
MQAGSVAYLVFVGASIIHDAGELTLDDVNAGSDGYLR